MSSFNGIIAEYSFISVDYFCDRALQACAFFLSHFHSDHMTGLQSDIFYEKLRFGQATLFMHRATFELLLSDRRYGRLEPYIKAWETNVPFLVYSTGDECAKSVTVTLLPGGHCLGSVMFLFEGAEGPVLYTGDERVNLFDWKNFPILHFGGELKQLTGLYFDSTFCTPETRRFPSRRDAAEAASKVAANWLKQNSNNHILLLCPYHYGYEFLFCQLSGRLKQKIHVNEKLLQAYRTMADIANCLTDSCDGTRLHAFVSSGREWDNIEEHGRCKFILPRMREGNRVLTLKPSVMWFARRKNTKCVKYFTSRTVCHILYSNHSSLDEVVEMVSYLKPKKLYPCVLPSRCSFHDFQRFLVSSPLGQFQLNLGACLRAAATEREVDAEGASGKQFLHRKTIALENSSSILHVERRSSAASYVISLSSDEHQIGDHVAVSSSRYVVQESAVQRK